MDKTLFEKPTQGSFSQAQELHNCEWRWWFGRQYQAVERNAPPDLGTAVHLGIAEVLRGNDPLEAIHQWGDQERTRLEKFDEIAPEAVNDGFDILAEVEMKAPYLVQRWKHWWDQDCGGWTIHMIDGKPAIEYPFQVQTERGIFNFIVDVLTQDPNGALWVLDWKVRQQFLAVESEESNLQKGLYQWGLAKLGIQTIGSAIVQIYPEAPGVPSVNKNGTISRTKIRTTWDAYRETCLANGQNPDDYLDQKEKIEAAGWEWFKMNRVYRTAKMWNAMAEHILWPTLERGKAIHAGSTPIRAMSQYRCTNCWAKFPCHESLQGTPLNELTLGYERRSDRNVNRTGEIG